MVSELVPGLSSDGVDDVLEAPGDTAKGAGRLGPGGHAAARRAATLTNSI